MLLVIFGAGASYDSSATYPALANVANLDYESRPPLADQLFDNRDLFQAALQYYPDCQAITTRLRQRGKQSLEEQMQLLQEEGDIDPRRHKQLVATRYYLQEVLYNSERSWLTQTGDYVTNYQALLDEVEFNRRDKGQDICLATFNYDTLLERALSAATGHQIKQMTDYISSHYKVIKLHGSVDWGREIKEPIDADAATQVDGRHIPPAVIARYADLTITDKYHLVKEQSPIALGPNGRALFPAMAIPVQSKQEFECPAQHYQVMGNLLSEVDKVLIIGWKAAEKKFLKDLCELQPSVKGMVVCGNADSGQATVTDLTRAGVHAQKMEAYNGGFTDIVGSAGLTELRQFLQS